MKDIPLHQLKERGNTGLEIRRFVAGDMPYDEETMGAHRDDHYIFFVIEEGLATLMIDFHELTFHSSTLFYILPGQVHHRIRNEVGYGWFIAIDSLLIAPDYRNVFETQLLLQQPFILNETQLRQCTDLLSLMQEKYQENTPGPFYLQVVHSLLQSFVGIAAGCFSEFNTPQFLLSRPVQLAQQFKKLLTDHVRQVKSPSVYAGMLNVSETYLNEALKKVTGVSVSHSIQQEVMLEAKRLLYYSQMNVKEIAHALGYNDHTYFSRLFKKSEGVTPLLFRTHYRK
ncbi:helix-turn-helix domain-containing protein [Mucilaginibacter sp. SP1R1]|uniref:helix-turn-helix domain-containing protein n=1 Tax=Mucilaginibacter sp. SP1R1 TaxID=2723091 RepID=UPI001609790B|nr:AraC family transcriptional regulator [Mucilaginibacter sp. SP1R1]MBB6151172.1 AraC-like DNA-binding protein [Mucilaginibacter sp. SP1R1]